MRTYAEVSDVEAWTGQTAPDNAEAMVRRASTLVQAACRCDLYDTDPAGLPAEDDVSDAMRDAVCAQVGVWQAADVDASAGAAGVSPSLTSSKILDAQVSYDGGGADSARRSSTARLDAESWMILRNAGLASANVSTKPGATGVIV